MHVPRIVQACPWHAGAGDDRLVAAVQVIGVETLALARAEDEFPLLPCGGCQLPRGQRNVVLSERGHHICRQLHRTLAGAQATRELRGR